MNILVPITIIIILIVFFSFKWNNTRTKFAFFFMILGLAFILFMVFLFTSGENFDFSKINIFFSTTKTYLVWMKGLFVNAFEFTGRIVGLEVNPSNSTLFGK